MKQCQLANSWVLSEAFFGINCIFSAKIKTSLFLIIIIYEEACFTAGSLTKIIGSYLTDAAINIKEVSEKGGKIKAGKRNWYERKESYKILANAQKKLF